MQNLTLVFSAFKENHMITYVSHFQSQFKVRRKYFFVTDKGTSHGL